MKNLLKTLPIVVALGLASVSNAQITYNGNGNNGFGGPIGNAILSIIDDGTTVTFNLSNPGGIPFSGNDAFVLYLDTVAGGLNSTATLNDTGDTLRRAISNIGSAAINFAAGFTADKAIGVKPFGTNNGFAGLWNLTGSPTNLPFIATSTTGTNGLTPETGGQNSYTWSFTLAQLGISPGASFNFVGIYLNAQDSFGNTFLSNEGFGNGLPNTNPGTGTATFTNFLTYTTIPEPSTYALIVGGLALLYFVVRRKATSQV